MSISDYRYSIEIYDDEGRALGATPIEVDWEPAVESTRFDAIRAGQFPTTGGPFDARVTPRWHATLGRPFTSGFRVEVWTSGIAPVGGDFASAYFHSNATAAAERLVADGRLPTGATFRYTVAAFDVERRAPDPADEGTSGPTPLRLRDAALTDHGAGSELRGPSVATDPAVFLPRGVLDEVSRLARLAGARETGGVLIGDLYRDNDGPDVFSVVAAQIPATQARGELSRLTFTPETWAEIHTILAMRGRGETMLGWWHSHPAYEWKCKDCPVERRRRCPLAAGFLSAEDRALHRAVFPRAYSVALVVNLITADEHNYALFGWREGLLLQRGFHMSRAVARAFPDARTNAEVHAEPVGRAEGGA